MPPRCQFHLVMASNSEAQRHLVRFEGNNSKKWDGKEVWLDPYVFDELYDPKELLHGAKLSVPFKVRGGKSPTGMPSM